MTNRFELVELQRSHLPTLNAWRNDRDLVMRLGGNFLYIGPEIDAQWYDNYLRNRHSAVRLAILERDSKVHVGNVNLTQIVAINRSAEFSILIGDRRYWHAGAGTFAVESMLRHGFLDLNLHRIWLTVLPDNVPAIKLYLKHGFKEEGRQRQAAFKEGRYHDLIMMALLRDEYTAPSAAP